MTNTTTLHVNAAAVNAPPDRLVGSVVRAVTLLSLLAIAPGGRLGVTAAARHLGVGKSTAHQLLSTLVATGFAEQDGTGGHYRLGPRALEVGVVALEQLGPGAFHLQPLLTQVAASFGEAVSIGVLAGTGVLLIQRIQSEALLRVEFRVGSRLPLATTAAGHVLLAGCAPEKRAALLEQLGLPPQDRARLVILVDAAERNGYAEVVDVPVDGVSAISTPLRDPSGRVLAALIVAGPSVRFRPAEHRVAAITAADRLAASLYGER